MNFMIMLAFGGVIAYTAALRKKEEGSRRRRAPRGRSAVRAAKVGCRAQNRLDGPRTLLK